MLASRTCVSTIGTDVLPGRDLFARIFNLRCLLARWRTRLSACWQEGLCWLRYAPMSLWMLPSRVIGTAVTYMARQPLFVVKFKAGRGRQDAAAVEGVDNAQLALKSTKAVWLWCAASTACVAFTITANPRFALFGTVVSLAWLYATGELSRHRRSPGMQAFASTALYGASPPATRWKRFATWTPAAVFCTLGSAYAFLPALLPVLDTPVPRAARAYGATPFLLTAVLVAIALFAAELFFYRHFHLRSLQSWYQRMPWGVKQLLQPTLNQRIWRRRFFSSTWRTIPDIASELNTAGTYVALFSEDRVDRPIWRRSRAGLVWYFAPLIVPIAALTFTPLLMAALPCYGGMDERTKVAYGCGAVVWAAWSFCYFLYFCARDFIEPLRYSSARYGHLSHVLLFDNMRDRKEVEGFFVGSGKTAYDALIVLVPAAFMGFLGLFSSSETKDGGQAEICSTFCYDALRQACGSLGMLFSWAGDAVVLW